MAKNALKKITRDAKKIRNRHPRKFKKWSEYVAYASKHPVKSRRKKVSGLKSSRKKSSKKKVARKRSVKQKPKVLRTIERASVERTIGKKRRGRSHKKRSSHRPRRISGSGGSGGLLLGLAVGAGALFLLSGMNKKPATTTNPYPYQQLPPVQQTGNYTRDTQSQQIVNYAIAAGIAINAISSLIDRLNSSSDDDIKYIYDDVSTSGNIEMYA